MGAKKLLAAQLTVTEAVCGPEPPEASGGAATAKVGSAKKGSEGAPARESADDEDTDGATADPGARARPVRTAGAKAAAGPTVQERRTVAFMAL